MLFKAMEEAKELQFKARGLRLKKFAAIELKSKMAKARKMLGRNYLVCSPCLQGECRTESGQHLLNGVQQLLLHSNAN